MKRYQMTLLSLLIALAPTVAPADPVKNECVVLLHGLGRTEKSMLPVQVYLEMAGYQVVNQSYPSTQMAIEELADRTLPKAVTACGSAEKIHFVTHSMGGILLRQWLSENKLGVLGRSVMLGPPNAGSELVDAMSNLQLFEFLNGPAGLELGTTATDLPQALGDMDFDVGVIAGSRPLNPLMPLIMDKEADGKVSVSSALSANPSDSLVLPVTHTFMMMNLEVLRQMRAFIEDGSFIREGV